MMMSAATPHFLLFSEAQRNAPCNDDDGSDPGREPGGGKWRFLLEALDGSTRLDVAEREPQVQGERLDLLAVVRGLEALDQPSRVTLVTASRYVSRGLRHGLDQWRESNWQWERFGKMAPIKDSDLWQRIDHALRFHQVECRTWRFESLPAEPDPDQNPDRPARFNPGGKKSESLQRQPDPRQGQQQAQQQGTPGQARHGRLSGLLRRLLPPKTAGTLRRTMSLVPSPA